MSELIHKISTVEMIAVMKAFTEGKEIQYYSPVDDDWHTLNKNITPSWNWEDTQYRIAPEKKYRPYSGIDEFEFAMVAHGYFVKHKSEARYETREIISGYGNDGVVVGYVNYMTYEALLENYTWTDGKPCGHVALIQVNGEYDDDEIKRMKDFVAAMHAAEEKRAEEIPAVDELDSEDQDR